jgi:hypothetical protein
MQSLTCGEHTRFDITRGRFQVPAAYTEVLGMLRDLDHGGAWPSTSKRRQELIRPREVTQV